MTSILTLVSNTADGVCAIDLSQHIVLWNVAASTLTGFTAAEALGQSCFQVFAGRSDSGYRVCRPLCPHVTCALSQEAIPAFEMKTRHKSGEPLWLSVSTLVVPSRWSELSVLIHVFREISEQKESLLLAQQLLTMVSRLYESQKNKPNPTLTVKADSIGLTRRETEVLRLLGAGTPTNKIAVLLAVRPATVRAHIQKILSKLGVHSRLEAVTLAIRNGLI